MIDGVSIYLGMEQSVVETAMGKGQLVGKRYYFYDNEMAIDYSENKTVEFIEFLGGIDGSLHPVIYGVSVFDTLADGLANLLRQKNDGEIDDSEQGYSFAFLNISVGVYRERRPSDVMEMIDTYTKGKFFMEPKKTQKIFNKENKLPIFGNLFLSTTSYNMITEPKRKV